MDAEKLLPGDVLEDLKTGWRHTVLSLPGKLDPRTGLVPVEVRTETPTPMKDQSGVWQFNLALTGFKVERQGAPAEWRGE